MGKFSVYTQFRAIDNISSVAKEIKNNINNLAVSGSIAFHKLQRAERGFVNRLEKRLGFLGKLGLGFGVYEIGSHIISSQVKLDSSLQSLKAITGITGDEFEKFRLKIEDTAKTSHAFLGDVAKLYERVGAAMPETFEDPEKLQKIVSGTITLARSANLDFGETADQLTSVMAQFGLGADETDRAINALAAGAAAGRSELADTAQALTKFGAGADKSNMTLEESVAILELFANKTGKGADAGVWARNIIILMDTIKAAPKPALKFMNKLGVNLDFVADTSKSFTERLKEFSKVSDDASTAVSVFGKENYTAGVELLSNVDKVNLLKEAVTGTKEANKQAGIQTFTLAKRWEDLTHAFVNYFMTTKNSTGGMRGLKDFMAYLTKNMETILNYTRAFLAIWIGAKLISGIGLIVNAIRGVIVVVSTLNAVTSANPFIAILSTTLALIAAIYTYRKEISGWFSGSFWDKDTVEAKKIIETKTNERERRKAELMKKSSVETPQIDPKLLEQPTVDKQGFLNIGLSKELQIEEQNNLEAMGVRLQSL